MKQLQSALAVAVWAAWTDTAADPSDQLVGELCLTSGAIDTELERSGDVVASRGAGDAGCSCDRALTPLSQRCSSF